MTLGLDFLTLNSTWRYLVNHLTIWNQLNYEAELVHATIIAATVVGQLQRGTCEGIHTVNHFRPKKRGARFGGAGH